MKNPSKFESKHDDEFLKAVLEQVVCYVPDDCDSDDSEDDDYLFVDDILELNDLRQKPMETFTNRNWKLVNSAIDYFLKYNIQNGKYNQRALSLKKQFDTVSDD